jgi:hypothetical protein
VNVGSASPEQSEAPHVRSRVDFEPGRGNGCSRLGSLAQKHQCPPNTRV